MDHRSQETYKRDRAILRQLGERKAEIAELSAQERTKSRWKRLNQLEGVRPLVWINEIPWEEMEVGGELELQVEDPFLRGVEEDLRRTIYKWKHMPADMVVEGKVHFPLAIEDSGFGISEESEMAPLEAGADGGTSGTHIRSRGFRPQIESEEDLEKIEIPCLTHDRRESRRRRKSLQKIFEGILEVEGRGTGTLWFAPWDQLVTWWGVEEALKDLIARPELVHRGMERLINAHLARLDQLEEEGLLTANAGNVRVGSGGLGYTDELSESGTGLRPGSLWGCATAQIFVDVSPEMHREFALRHELRWLKEFGLTYYGCCEPLHNKIDILKEVSNLRKISISPWADLKEGAKKIERDYVLSYKPSPAVLAEDEWKPSRARDGLREVLEEVRGRGCNVEIIMKDISTVRGKPHRLWEWAELALAEAERVG